MDGLLRGQEQSEVENTQEIERLFERAFNFQEKVVLFPVRHHSPTCSSHILKTIEEYQPEAILVEGPENANHLIDFIVSAKTKAPFCIYLSYDDKKGEIAEEPDIYKAYYPFLDYSPELVSLREGRKRGLHCGFIDLSYGEKLLNAPKNVKEDTYDTDREFLLGSYHKMLTAKMGCKSFNELWEMLFEIDGCHSETKDFVRNLFYYCYYTRAYSEKDELESQGDIIREYQMADNILKAMEQYQKILVVTGGIHTIALSRLLFEEGALPKHKIKKEGKNASPGYLMPYSFEASDQSAGYDSGMVFPYFYQKVWENVEKGKKNPYVEAVLRFIINTAGVVRKKQALSISDEMQSYYMAQGLAELRGKKECGVFEVIDAVKSSFVKGEMNSFHQPALKTLYQLMTGMEMGIVDPDAGVPPLVNDFLEQCRIYKIQTNTSLKKETKLDTYNNPAHRDKSRFFHQMSYLGTNFCRYLKGQDDNAGTGRILLRETWEYRFAPQVQVELISNSAYGGTLRQACLTRLKKEFTDDAHSNGRTLSEMLLQANYMGIDEVYSDLGDKISEIIGDDVEFLSVMDCFQNLCKVKSYGDMFHEPLPFLENIIELTFNRIMTLLYTVFQVKKEEEDPVCDGIKFIYNYFIENGGGENEESFLQGMQSLYSDLTANGSLTGVSGGILLKKGKLSLTEVITRFNSYLLGSEEAKKLSASFLKGFFRIAKDIIFVDDRLITSLDGILKETSGDLFLEILPDLRLAFTYFLPFETDKIAKQVSELYHVSETAVLYGEALDQKEMEQAAFLDGYCGERLAEWLGKEMLEFYGRQTDTQ